MVGKGGGTSTRDLEDLRKLTVDISRRKEVEINQLKAQVFFGIKLLSFIIESFTHDYLLQNDFSFSHR